MENLAISPVLLENEFLRRFAETFKRSKNQINGLLESDAELIHLDKELILAITTDAIVEEIHSGLYRDPWHIGWMSVIVNISDLAAVGARPLGILINLTITEDTNQEFLVQLQEGISRACQQYNIHVFGGDTNTGGEFQIGGVAIGLINDKGPIVMRNGMQPGDLVFSTDGFGLGGYFAFEKLTGDGSNKVDFYPAPDIKRAEIVRKFGSSCIDTSDGFFAAAGNLMELNKCGFKISGDINQLVKPDIVKNLEAVGIPPWYMLAGPHGEFELLFTVKRQNIKPFFEAANAINWSPVSFGEVVTDPLLFFEMKGCNLNCKPAEIANIYQLCKGDVNQYIRELGVIDRSWKH